MHRENFSTLNLLASRPIISAAGPVDAARNISADQKTGTTPDPEAQNLLSKHKGKLAVGAAAMLGVAIFYKWRENQLAREDPEEYARLQRLKHVLESREAQPEQKG